MFACVQKSALVIYESICWPSQDHTIAPSWKFPLGCHSALRNFLPRPVPLEISIVGENRLRLSESQRNGGISSSLGVSHIWEVEEKCQYWGMWGQRFSDLSVLQLTSDSSVGWALTSRSSPNRLPSCSDPPAALSRSLLIWPDSVSTARERKLPLSAIDYISRSFIVKVPGPSVISSRFFPASTIFSDSLTLYSWVPSRGPTTLSFYPAPIWEYDCSLHISLYPRNPRDLMIQSIYFFFHESL